MSKLFNFNSFRRARNVFALASVAVLSGCGTISEAPDLRDFFPAAVGETVQAREFITIDDVEQIELGMSIQEVQNRLGIPSLSDPANISRWDYALRRGEGVTEEFIPYGIYFENNRVVQLAILGPLEQTEQQPVAQPVAPSVQPLTAMPELPPLAEEIMPTFGFDASANNAALISDLLNGWVASWAGQNVNAYLDFYAVNFKHGMSSRKAWERKRKSRLERPKFVSVSLSNVQINLVSDTSAIVTFTQDYAADRYKDTGFKTLELVKQGTGWYIQKETFKKMK